MDLYGFHVNNCIFTTLHMVLLIKISWRRLKWQSSKHPTAFLNVNSVGMFCQRLSLIIKY